jgi:hypothetical protein
VRCVSGASKVDEVTQPNGYTVTPASRRALTIFRRTLPPAGALLKTCPRDGCVCNAPDVIAEEADIG